MFNFLKTKKISDNIEQKSVQNQLTGSVTSIYSDFNSSVYLPSDSVNVLNYNRGYANSCIRLISQSIADLPYYLYRISNTKNGKYIGKSLKVTDKKFLSKVDKQFSMGDYTLDKIFEHPFLSILEENMERSMTEFFYLVSQYLLTIGNAYILIERSPAGKLVNLKLLMSEFMSVKFDNNFKITEYQYQPLLNGAKSVNYLPKDILHIKRTVAGSMIVGRGVLEECLISVSLSEETKKYLNCLLTNSMTPKNMIVVKNSIKSEEEANRIKTKFQEQFGGFNRGKSAVVFGDITVEDVAQNMGDNKVVETNEYVKKEICAMFSVPLDLIDTSDSNRATSVVAQANFTKNTIFPFANSICDQITRGLIQKEYDNSFIWQYATDESIESDPKAQAELYKMYLDMGIITKEEIIAKLGI